MSRAARGARGFTFIEVTLVLIVAGLALSIAAVSLGKLYESRSIRGELRRTHSIISGARDEAVFRREGVTLSIIEGGRVLVVSYDRGQSPASYPLREGFVMKGDPVRFYPKGNSSGGKIEIAAPGGKAYAFTIEAVTGTATLGGL